MERPALPLPLQEVLLMCVICFGQRYTVITRANLGGTHAFWFRGRMSFMVFTVLVEINSLRVHKMTKT